MDLDFIIITAIAFIVSVLIRRKKAFIFRFKPTKHTWVAIGTGLLAFLLSLSMLLFDYKSVISRVIYFGLIFFGCGFAIPWAYTQFKEKSGLSDMGIKYKNLKSSLIAGIIIAILFSLIIIFEGDFSNINGIILAKAILVFTGTGGLFEIFLYYGFIHNRLEKAFGSIIAIFGTAFLYVLWHVGTQLPYEVDPVNALLKLFLVGILFQSIYSTTRNIFIIWPFFHLTGVLIDFIVNINNDALI